VAPYDYADAFLFDECAADWVGTTMPCVETVEQNHALVKRSGTPALGRRKIAKLLADRNLGIPRGRYDGAYDPWGREDDVRRRAGPAAPRCGRALADDEADASGGLLGELDVGDAGLEHERAPRGSERRPRARIAAARVVRG